MKLTKEKMTEKEIIEKMQEMCEESLSPESFEEWQKIRVWLEYVRKDLK